MQERRSHPRVQQAAIVTVIVQSAPETPDLEGKVFPCRLKDVSLGGIKLWVDVPVPIGALLELEIVFNHSPERYHHTGNVVWVWEGEGLTDWQNVGIKFNISAYQQFNIWESAISRLLETNRTN
jgi:hypothetical protein